ncbi:MAG: hypothetical protein K0Q72_3513 [Armatimonadetes bacterium]|jgi:hypothetical protein|nr:hypothetical protein [Armatimonadota bacterium]
MIILEILITVVLAIGLVAAVLLWLTRPLWGAVARRVRIEKEAERLKSLNARVVQSAREDATVEVKEWMEKAGIGKPLTGEAGGLAGALNPALRAIMERYPVDPRVQELANVYRQATGRELLPERLRQVLDEGAAGQAATGPAAKPTAEEQKVLDEARREVAGWLSEEQEQPARRAQREK